MIQFISGLITNENENTMGSFQENSFLKIKMLGTTFIIGINR